ncbi:hypothetical protein BKA70DRAFT_1231331 [Coprinopsis sp. MPI-PUGE-AT-0042]|nr:hypothetical protein BKA70DRAFT_1231331 [Coprinopsis sp. MPI-PUGE-AT-0042]
MATPGATHIHCSRTEYGAREPQPVSKVLFNHFDLQARSLVWTPLQPPLPPSLVEIRLHRSTAHQTITLGRVRSSIEQPERLLLKRIRHANKNVQSSKTTNETRESWRLGDTCTYCCDSSLKAGVRTFVSLLKVKNPRASRGTGALQSNAWGREYAQLLGSSKSNQISAWLRIASSEDWTAGVRPKQGSCYHFTIIRQARPMAPWAHILERKAGPWIHTGKSLEKAKEDSIGLVIVQLRSLIFGFLIFGFWFPGFYFWAPAFWTCLCPGFGFRFPLGLVEPLNSLK